MPVLLALHLVAAQASMLQSPTQAGAERGAGPAAATLHCHDIDPAGDSGPAHDTAPATRGHCDPGQCHCPVALVPDPTATIGHAAFLRRVDPVLPSPGKPSQRDTPDLRPPILR
jgi:hypothetical protein